MFLFPFLNGGSLLVGLVTAAAALRLFSHSRDRRWPGNWTALLAIGFGVQLLPSLFYLATSFLPLDLQAAYSVMQLIDVAGTVVVVLALATIEIPEVRHG